MAGGGLGSLRVERDKAVRILSVVGLLLLWEVAAGRGWIHPAFFPAPTSVGQRLGELFGEGILTHHTLVTLHRLLWAFLAAALPGVALGLVLGVWSSAREVADPVVAFLYPIPSVLFFPLASLVLGRGEAARILTASVTPFFLMLLNTTAGVRQLDRGVMEAAMHYGAVGARLFWKVLFPGTLPWILTGARLGLGLALIVTVAVEMVGAEAGLGAYLWLSWQTLRVAEMYATLFVVALLGLTITYGVERLGERLLPWLRRFEGGL